MPSFLKPKYIPLVQKPLCCNVTCLMMILYRRGYGLFDQEELAQYFDVRVGEKTVGAFNLKLNTYTDTGEAGLQTVESEKIIDRFFKQRSILLTAKAVRVSEITDLQKFLRDHLGQNDDLWVEYKAHRIHESSDPSGSEYVHDGLVEGLEECKTSVTATIIDPTGTHKPRFRVDMETLWEALSSKFGKETGFIVVSSKIN